MKDESHEISSTMESLEKDALMHSHFRIAVSEKLVEYWKEKYNYVSNLHVIIPCTISGKKEVGSGQPEDVRTKLGIKENEILLVYSGSASGWQSLNLLEDYLSAALKKNSFLKILLLTKPPSGINLKDKFQDRVIYLWVEPEKVSEYLTASDYGLLIRESSVTNSVCSPVKFAEYLAAGLPVIISENIGDFSIFVKDNNCGFIASEIKWESLKRPSSEEKSRIQEVAELHFSKEVYKEFYALLI
jgi:glycosyltransferase involved in cell wall biosynthesis